MIALDATTDSLEVDLTGAVTTNQLPFVAAYVDVSQSTFAMTASAGNDGTTNNTTAVTLVAAPGASTSRILKYLSIKNSDTVATELWVQLNANATLREIWKGTLAVGDTLVYVDSNGWNVINASGSIKNTFANTFTATRVPFAGSDGILTTDSGFTFNTTGDVLTVGQLVASGNSVTSDLIVSAGTTATVFNTTATTVNAFGAATSLKLGAAGAAVAFNAASRNDVRHYLSGAFTSGGLGTSAYGVLIDSTITGASGDTTRQVQLACIPTSTVTGGNTEVIGIIATAYFSEPVITLGTGDTCTVAANVYVNGAPTEGATNAAIYVTSGDVMMGVAAAGRLFIGDTANANMTVGLTINGGANDNQHFCIKNSDVAHGLTSGGALAAETDDFFHIQKVSSASGGVAVMCIGEDSSAGQTLFIGAYGGLGETTDTTASTGLVNIVVAEHDGANATIAAPTNQNIFTIRAATGAATYATRLLLKGDDGELHLGNTTLVALDDEDDALIVRAMQKAMAAGGIIESQWDNPLYSYSWLRERGLVGEKDERGQFLFPLQPRLALHGDAIWQNYCRTRSLEERLNRLEARNADHHD